MLLDDSLSTLRANLLASSAISVFASTGCVRNIPCRHSAEGACAWVQKLFLQSRSWQTTGRKAVSDQVVGGVFTEIDIGKALLVQSRVSVRD